MDKPLLYLDTGALSRMKTFTTSIALSTVVFSDAVLIDLKNSSDPSPELDFLDQIGALHIHETEGQVFAEHTSPHDRFEAVNRVEADILGKMLSFFHGGGETKTAQQSALDMIRETLSELGLHETFQEYFVEATKGLNITNREIEAHLDRGNPKIPESEENPLQSVFDALPESAPDALNSVFPKSCRGMSIQDMRVAVHALSTMGIGRSKGIRKQSQHAEVVGAHDALDAYHIAFGLFCQAFITNDNATATKFQALRKFWGVATELWIIKGAPQGAFPTH